MLAGFTFASARRKLTFDFGGNCSVIQGSVAVQGMWSLREGSTKIVLVTSPTESLVFRVEQGFAGRGFIVDLTTVGWPDKQAACDEESVFDSAFGSSHRFFDRV